MIDPAEAAQVLRRARLERRTIERFTSAHADLTGEWAYAVQELDLQARRLDGELLVGRKLGLTSDAKQATMGIDQPIYGFLTDAMRLDSTLLLGDLGQPRVEPELVLRLARDLDRAITIDEVAHYADAVTVGAEVIDSRYTDYRFAFADVVADAASAGAFALGPWRPLAGLDFDALHGSIAEDDVEVHRAPLTAVLGDPLRALVLLSQHLAGRGETLDAGSIMFSGAITDAIPLRAGSRYTASINGIGDVVIAAA